MFLRERKEIGILEKYHNSKISNISKNVAEWQPENVVTSQIDVSHHWLPSASHCNTCSRPLLQFKIRALLIQILLLQYEHLISLAGHCWEPSWFQEGLKGEQRLVAFLCYRWRWCWSGFWSPGQWSCTAFRWGVTGRPSRRQSIWWLLDALTRARLRLGHCNVTGHSN